MNQILHRIGAAAALIFASVVCLIVPEVAGAADARPARAPQNAFSKQDREDLSALIRANGEIRVIVGLQTPDEIAQGVDRSQDQVKEQAVSSRQQRVLQRAAGYKVRNVKRFRWHHFMAMTVDATALNALLADSEVTSVAEDRPLYPVLLDTPGITRADKAWAEGFRGAGQTVAIIDSGVDKTHPFFTGKVVAEACFSQAGPGSTTFCPNGQSQQIGSGAGVNCSDSSLPCWHGTHVAGIATGNYGVLSATTGGIAPSANVIAIQVFQRDCSSGTCAMAAYDSDLVHALEYVYSLRTTYSIASANMSLGGSAFSATCDSASPAMTSVIQSLRNAGIATVVAAGNDGNAGAISYPACITSAISVGSTTKQNAISSFSNSASFLSLLAPGSSVTSSVPGGGFGTASGTSMATPHVTGAWAVLKSAKPSATVPELLSALQSGGLPITDPRNGIAKSLIQLGYDNATSGALGLVLGHGNLAPTVSITSPVEGAVFVAPQNITVTAAAADSDGGISKVEFFQGANKIASITAAPYSFVWSGVPPGNYTLTAVATDVLGGTTTSVPVHFAVTAPGPNTSAQITGTMRLGSAPLAGVNVSAAGGACVATDSSGQYTCWVSLGWTGTVTPSLSGYTFTPSSRSYSNVTANQSGQDYAAQANVDTVWVEDAVPAGATADGYIDGWNWVSANPAPFSGSLAHQSALASGLHQHYFYSATSTLTVGVGDRLFAYVYLDPANPPSAVMLQWNDGSWEHRAYWGANDFPSSWGTEGTASRYSMGALPPAGQWVRLEVPAALVGLEGHTLSGMAFTLQGGRATWDYAGKRQPTYQLSGTVAVGASALSGVTLTAAAGASCTPSNASGQYSCTVPYGWTGTVTPSRAGYTFTPPSRNYSNVTANQTAQDYAATPITYAVSGTVTLSGAGLGNVSMAATNGVSCSTTNASGQYSCAVPYGWTGTVTPSRAGYTFTPSSRNYSNVTANQTAQDYAAMPITFAVSGTVTLSGAGLGNVSMAATNGVSCSTTNASGQYSCAVPYGWTGTATPSRAGYTFTPSSRNYSNVTANQTAQDYAATPITFAVSGTVTLSGAGLGNVSMAATNGVSCSTTNASGQYSCAVPYGWTGTVTPSRAGYTFTPPSRNYSNVTANQTAQDYAATPITFAVSGTVTLSGAGLGSVSMAATNGVGCSTTNASGQYSCTVPQGWTGTVTPSLAGYTFTPPSRSYSSVSANQTAQDYAAAVVAPTAYTLSGTVTLSGAGLGGVSMSATGAGTSCSTTNASGQYSCTVPPGWTGTMTPSLIGYTFTPSSRSYSNVTANQSAQDYTAAAGTDVVWVEDAVPAGATADGYIDGWNWVSANPAPFSGSLAHQSGLVSGIHQHYFSTATATLSVGVGDTLFTYVYLDPANSPTEVMLQWYDGTWEHRAYWGANLIPWGTDGSVSRRYMGALPPAGQWVRLEVPAALVGLEGHTLSGMAFTLQDGRATWDKAGKAVAATPHTLSGTVTLSGAGLGNVSMAATNGVSCSTTNASGQYSCTAPYGWTGTVTPALAGYTFTPSSRSYSNVTANQSAQDYTAAAGTDVVWVEDAVPAGATADGYIDGWNWVSANPAPFSGSLAHQSGLVSGIHQHYFSTATATLSVGVGDTLFTYVYLDPANSPTEVMLQWYDGTWEHRAYWGANLIPWGTDGSVSRRYMGALPPAGQWVRLEVPAALVGLEGHTLSGMAFTLQDGRATWDYAGKRQPTYQLSGTVAVGATALSGVTLTAAAGVSCTPSNASGHYSCTVPQGWSGTVTPVLSGYTFTPASRSYTNVAVNQATQDYAATPITFAVSGTVTLSGAGLGNVSMAATNGVSCSTTNASGQYSCTVPYGWTGTVTPSLAGYAFTPPSRSYSNVTANQTAQNYTAAAVGPTTFQVSGTVTLSGAGLGSVSMAATNGVSCSSTNAAGQYSCTVPQGWTGAVTPSLNGYTFTPSSRSYNNVTANQTVQDYAAQANVETVWVEDAVPAGATADGYIDGWNWVSANPAPFSGSLAHQSGLASGAHQHYFYNATSTLTVGVGDYRLFAYVYLDPANSPTEVMLQWYDGTWEHRAYWGANLIPWGTDGSVSRYFMGALPPAGQWVRLEVPASMVGLEGSTLNGMAFTVYDGLATWDRAGLTANSVPQITLTAPVNQATYTAPASVTINANASDSDGVISAVEFYWGATLLAKSKVAPYSFNWTNVPAGNYTLTAKAYDNLGGATVSAPVTITVNPTSAVSTAPNRPTVTQNGSSIVVSWDAVQNATGYTVYAAYSASAANIYRSYPSSSTSITIPVTDFSSLRSLYFSVAAIVGGNEAGKSNWAYLLNFDAVDLGVSGVTIAIADSNSDGCIEQLGTLNDCSGNLIARPWASLGLSALFAPGRVPSDVRMADFNGDGIPDLLASSYDSFNNTASTLLLFYGRGDGTFIQATPQQFPTIYRGFGETIVVADFDNDGRLDIFMPHYTHNSPQEQNYLFRNNGDGTFTEIADSAGVANRNWPLSLKVEGAQALDINGDGFLDIYAGSHLYINNGNMTFTDKRQEYGLPLFFDEGAKFFDWNNDGYIDLVLHDLNNGPSLFQFDGRVFRWIDNVFPARRYVYAWGLNAEDVDGDGFLDLMVPGSSQPNGPDNNASIFLKRGNGYVDSNIRTNPDGAFADSFGFGDFDANGTIDIVLRTDDLDFQSNTLIYLKNTASDASSIKVFMLGEGGAQNQHGRTIRATPQRDPAFIMSRVVDGGSGYVSNNEYAVTFPAPKGDMYWITAQFDNGIVSGWASAGSIVKVYRDGRFLVQSRP